MGSVKRKRATRFRGARVDSGRMRTRASVFGLVALLLPALPASSIAIERDRIDNTSGWSTGQSRTAVTARDDSKAIAKLIRDINAAAQKDKRRMLSIIVINTNVAATTLERQKARTGLSFGDIYVAHALSLATRKKFDTIAALKAGGQSWSQIARAHKVSLKGSTELLKEMMKNS
jgi:PIN domain nuclease of toxin-antitoxin system